MLTSYKRKSPIVIMLLCLSILFGAIFLYKAFTNAMMKKYLAAHSEPIITISAMKADFSPWQPKLKASGSLRAVRGVDVTTEVSGMVNTILFKPGDHVSENSILVELNQGTEIAQLENLIAIADLAKIVYKRDKAQLDVQAVSQAVVDADIADLKAKDAKVEEQRAALAKKTLRAPFSGRLGINLVNLGQFLNPGDKVVTLQALNPIYIDFRLPQQTVNQLMVGQEIRVTTDSYPGRVFKGKITTIDPKVDPETRNLQVEALLQNPDFVLLPGMFANLEVDVGVPSNYLTLPQTAISFNPYGEIVFIIKEKGKDKQGKPILIANQTFITVGETRGDQIAILSGIQKNDLVVTAGQHKLKNGSHVVINNNIIPENNPNPLPGNETNE